MNASFFTTYRTQLLILLLAVVSYIPVVNCAFIWDDPEYVVNNQTLRSWSGLWQIWFDTNATPQYYPLVHSSYWIEYQLWELNPVGYHVNNVLLHAISGILLWQVLKRFQIPAPWLPAMIFVVHPVHVESVAWITERKNVLSGVFYLTSLLFFLKAFDFAEKEQKPETIEQSSKKTFRFYYGLSLVCFVCALLSKTVVATLPAAIMLILIMQGRTQLKKIFLQTLPFFLIGVPMGLFTAWAEKYKVGASDQLFDWTFLERLFLASNAIWFYAMKNLWPHPVIFFYPKWDLTVTEPSNYVPFILLAFFTLGLFLLRKKIGILPITAWCFFMGSLFPALGFLNVYPMRFSYVADHFQYLASIGVIVILSATLYWVIKKLMADEIKRNKAVVVCGALWILTLMVLTWNRIPTYKNQVSLWTETIRQNPKAYAAYGNLGSIYGNGGDPEKALEYHLKSVALEPGWAGPNLEVGHTLSILKRHEEALPYLKKAAELWPNRARPFEKLGFAYLMLNDNVNAKKAWERAIEFDPSAVDFHGNLYVCLRNLDMEAEAAERLKIMMKLAPENQLYQFQFIQMMLFSKDKAVQNPKAALQYAQAVSRNGMSDPDIYGLLAIAYLRNGLLENAKITLQNGIQFARRTNNQKLLDSLNAVRKDYQKYQE